jgi:alanine racemase
VKSPHTTAEISLRALSRNLDLVREKTGNTEVLAVVKADAYGHGAVRVARHLIKKGVRRLGVAYATEGIELRESGIDVPVTVFFDRDNLESMIEYGLTPVIYDLKSARRLSSLARKRNISYPVHIKIDTGMGRVGMSAQSAESEITRIASLPNLRLEGIMSHFSDADLQDKQFAHHQLRTFKKIVSSLNRKGIRFRYRHMANSAAVLTMPETHFNLVRPGLMLYGYGCCEKEKLMPAMKIKSRIILLKKVPAGTPVSYGRTFITRRTSVIATIPVGYADGYSRKLSNNGQVLISGRAAPVVGRVCMDTIMVDVTAIPDVDYTSEVVLLGKQGRSRITADDIAEKTGTIAYEVLTSVGRRVKRIYR